MEISKLKYPKIRKDLVFYCQNITESPEGWLSEEFGRGMTSYNVRFIINFFFDDTSFSDGANDYIGLALINSKEAQAMDLLVRTLDDFFNHHGVDLTDFECVSKPDWIGVMRQASEVYELVK